VEFLNLIGCPSLTMAFETFGHDGGPCWLLFPVLAV